MDRAQAWSERGSRYRWQPPGGDAEVEVFHVELGDPEAPPVVLVHGFPTSSVDWVEVAEALAPSHRVCALDLPGYGFSGKPRGWGYGLSRDAELLEHHVTEVLGLRSMVVLAHDRGSSVAMVHATQGSQVAHEHLVLTNGNIFLPLSTLTPAQRVMLDPEAGPDLLAGLSAQQLAEGVGAGMFTPPRGAGDPEVEAMAAGFAHDGGVEVIHETIQYLVERAEHEQGWLEALAASDVSTSLVWGLCDTVAPVRVALHVWHAHLARRAVPGALYLVPGANHYLQNDRPDALVEVLGHLLGDDATPPGPLGPDPRAPVLVDRTRPALPAAADLLGLPD